MTPYEEGQKMANNGKTPPAPKGPNDTDGQQRNQGWKDQNAKNGGK